MIHDRYLDFGNTSQTPGLGGVLRKKITIRRSTVVLQRCSGLQISFDSLIIILAVFDINVIRITVVLQLTNIENRLFFCGIDGLQLALVKKEPLDLFFFYSYCIVQQYYLASDPN